MAALFFLALQASSIIIGVNISSTHAIPPINDAIKIIVIVNEMPLGIVGSDDGTEDVATDGVVDDVTAVGALLVSVIDKP